MQPKYREVRVGQVYADNDRRSKGRKIKVVSITGSQVTYDVVAHATGVTPDPRRGKTFTSSIDRFHRAAQRGFTLLEDVQ